MSTTTIMWTALPNGFTADGNKLKLSILVSPRLATDGLTGTLAQFPDFLDWPATVAGLTFRVEFQGGPTITANPTIEPGFPSLDSAAWKELFNHQTPVTSYAFEDKVGLNVRSFPVKKVFSFLKSEYQGFAISSPATKPTLQQLGITRDRERNFGRLVIDPPRQKELDSEINRFLEENNAVPPQAGTTTLDFYQVQLMHQFLSKKVRKPDGSLEKLPPQKPPEVDFHRAIAAIGQYQKLMRALGIAIDLEVSAANLPVSSTYA